MKILFTSLGCDKNLVDSEMMLGQLQEKGYSFTDEEEEADIVVVNTCSFIKDAKEESIQTILEMAELKKAGSIKVLIVTGCLAQRYLDEIQEEIPEVDALLGIGDIDKIVETVEEVLQGEANNHVSDCNAAPVYGKKRVNTTGGHYAYLKIAEGCDKHCTYCIIPKIRGNFRSIPMDTLLAEAKTLAEEGVEELILVAQETTMYGVDLYGKKTLPLLLDKLCEIEKIKWIRLLYCYPEEITNELIATIKNQEKICHYLDIPIQHASDAVLKRMGRRTSRQDLCDVIEKLRREIPDICLRTTLISGFPGETKEDHISLYQFVNEMEFDRLGVFTYSPEENTPAATWENQIPEEIKEERRDELMELQQAIAFEKAEKMVGLKLTAVVEGYLPEEGVYVARTYMDAPGVDGYAFVYADRELLSGEFINIDIFDAREYDLVGKLIEDE